jgi:hypothetical protein
MVRRWRLIDYFPILYTPAPRPQRVGEARPFSVRCPKRRLKREAGGQSPFDEGGSLRSSVSGHVRTLRRCRKRWVTPEARTIGPRNPTCRVGAERGQLLERLRARAEQRVRDRDVGFNAGPREPHYRLPPLWFFCLTRAGGCGGSLRGRRRTACPAAWAPTRCRPSSPTTPGTASGSPGASATRVWGSTPATRPRSAARRRSEASYAATCHRGPRSTGCK